MSAAVKSNEEAQVRPGGITVLAVACFALGAYLACNGALVAAAVVSFASGRYLLGEYASLGPILYFVVAILLVVLGVGLLLGWRIVRRLTMVAAALLLATSVLPMSAAVAYFQIGPLAIHGLKIIVSVMAIRYLLQEEVVEYFTAKSAR